MRQPASLAVPDWCIIAAYGMVLVVVGCYYAKRTFSTEDYLLGGRRMASSPVGLSLFATLLSTITYLATPGEMINKGPMILCCVLSTFIAYFVVTRLLWMALIIYVMADKIIVVMMGWSEKMTPYVALVIGLVVKALTFLNDSLLPATSNAVERGFRRHRKMQKTVYRVRGQKPISRRIAIDIQRDDQAEGRIQTTRTLHSKRKRPQKTRQ